MTVSPEGRWHILATTLPFWRGKLGPTVEYTALGDGRLRDVLRWTQGGRPRSLSGTDTPHGDGYRWRGAGLLGLFASDWRFVEQTETMAVTWFARASFGVTPEGMDVYCREADLDVAPTITRLQADPRFAHINGWYPTER